jgi:prevent-host-death family protein
MNVALFDAKNRLSALLDRVERGEEITITRHGRPVARLVPATPGFDRDKARAALEEFRRLRKGVTLGGISIKELINEGRK